MRRTKSQIAIIEASKVLFKKQGFRKLSVEEISEAAGVSKMTFYRQFEGKMALVKTVLKELIEKGQEDYKAIMTSENPFPEKIKDFIKHKEENAKEFGEVLINDIYQVNEPSLQALLTSESEKSLERFITDLIQAQKEGWIRQDIKPEFINYMLNTLLKESQSAELHDLYPHSEDLAHEVLSFLFYGIMNSSKC